MRRALAWIITAALLVGAWFVALATPTDATAEAAFTINATVGEPAYGRNIAVTVLDVSATEAISSEDGWRAESTWIVVELDAQAVASQQGASLATATLHIGDRTFQATERGPSDLMMFRTGLVPGVPKSGSLAFEIPKDALAGPATIRLSDSVAPRYDSIVELRVDLDELRWENEITIYPVDWAGS